jgi:hypothetical protein
VNDTVNVWMLREHIVESFFIFDVKADKIWPLAADQFYTVENLLRRIVEVVCDNDFVASFEKGKSSEGANIACASAKWCQLLKKYAPDWGADPVMRQAPMAMLYAAVRDSEG